MTNHSRSLTGITLILTRTALDSLTFDPSSLSLINQLNTRVKHGRPSVSMCLNQWSQRLSLDHRVRQPSPKSPTTFSVNLYQPLRDPQVSKFTNMAFIRESLTTCTNTLIYHQQPAPGGQLSVSYGPSSGSTVPQAARNEIWDEFSGWTQTQG